MIQQMTARERTLAMIVGLSVFAFANMFLIQFFLRNHRQLRSDLTSRTAMLATMQTLLTERDLWVKRDQWLAEKQPKLANRDRAAEELRNMVKDVATKHGIVLENTVLGTAETKPHHVAVNVNFETRSKWQDLVAFIQELQSPEQFVVFESANFTADPGDKTQMRGRFKVARWYAPNSPR